MIVLPTGPYQNLRRPQTVELGIEHRYFVIATHLPLPGIQYSFRHVSLAASFPDHRRQSLTFDRAWNKHLSEYPCVYRGPVVLPPSNNLHACWPQNYVTY